jgi:hypothetical protein
MYSRLVGLLVKKIHTPIPTLKTQVEFTVLKFIIKIEQQDSQKQELSNGTSLEWKIRYPLGLN